MATDKPLADSDDDIIDLTDLVEEGSAGDAPSGDDGPVDMSFEQELDDLFGDAEPAAPATPQAAQAAGADDEDLIDLAGFDVDETPETAPAPAAAAATTPNDGADDDVMDLTGFGLDEAPEPAPAQATAANTGDDDDVMDLVGLGFDEIPAAPKAPVAAADTPAADDAMADLFGEAEAPARPAATAASPAPGDEADVLSSLGFELPEDAISLAGAGQTPEGPAEDAGERPDSGRPAAETAPDDEAMDLTDMDLSELEPAPAAAETPAPTDDTALADLLGQVSYAPDATDDAALDIAEISPLSPLEKTAEPAPDVTAAPGSTAAGEAAMAALTVAAAAGVTAGVAAMAQSAAPRPPAAATTAIDLGALDNLIDAARGPLPEPEPETAPDLARFNALAERIASLESTTATLYDKLETLPPATDGEALADALSARLEDALSERLEAVLAGQPPMPDVAGLRTDILAEIERRVPDRDSLLADVQAALAPQFEALRGELPQAGELAGQAETAAALDGLRESLARLEALTQGRQAKFEDFAAAMEARLAELRRELPGPDAYASTQGVSEALETLRENLSRDIAANLDERLAELRRELRETLAGDIATGLDERVVTLRNELGDSLDARVTELGGELRRSLADDMAGGLDERLSQARGELRQALADDIAASLDERLGDVVDAGRQAAATEVRSLGEALASRLGALENDRLDPEAVAERVRQALLPSLPDAEAVQEAGKAAARAEDAAAAAHSRLEDKAGYEDLDAALASLRTEMAAEIERAVPRAAAAVIREEIAALLKDFE
uniref:Uncharacterized protein n=1 Tax=Desulfovibrio sp. U5L TaxID=596152 RepID=I2PYE6_9BACT